MRPLFFVISFILFFLGKSTAQITVLDNRKGLSNNWVLDIIQDGNGLTWVGTGNGLNTYDGYTFKEVPAFKGMTINCLVYDSLRKCIWIGSRQGLFSIIPETGKVMDFTLKCMQKNVEAVLLHNDEVYFGFSNGLILEMDSMLNARIFFDGRKYHEKFYLCKHVVTIGWDDYLYVTFTGIDSLITIDLNKNRKKEIAYTNLGSIWNMFSFDSLLFLNRQQQGGFVFNERSKTFIKCKALSELNKKFPQPDNVYYKNNKVYVGYRGARSLFVIDLLKPDQPAIPMPDEKEILRGKLITCMLEDKHGVIWIGTSTGLIKVITEQSLPTKNFLNKQTTPVNIRQIVPGKDSILYVNTYQGIYRFDRRDNEATLFVPSIEKSIPFRSIILKAPDHIYLGTESTSQPFYRYDLKTKKFETDFIDKTRSVGDVEKIIAIHSFLEDANGLIWLATHKGLASFDPKKKAFRRYTEGQFSTGKEKLMFLYRSKKSEYFWATGKDGVYLIHSTIGVVKRFTTHSIPALPSDEFTSLSEAPDGSVWLGSKKNGIIILSPDFKNITQLKKSDGLSSDEVYSIVWTDSTVAWITTLNGLCRYDRANGTFSNYFKENGLPDNEFSPTSFYLTKDKKLFLGGVNGVTNFYPDSMLPSTEPFNVFFRSVLKWNSSSQNFLEVIPEGEERQIAMYPSDHLLTFELGAGDYSSSQGTSYYYKIKGLYNDWTELKEQNILRLEGLPVGSFNVEVIAFNNHGFRSANILTFQIKTIQVFYKKWWFYVLLFSLLVFIIYGYFRWRINEIKKTQNLRTEIASNLHDEVGSLLTSISIYTDNALHHTPTIEEKNAKLERIFSFSRDATSTMSDVLWSIDARNDYAGSLTDRIREHAELMLGPLGVEMEFDFTETDQEQTLKLNVRQNIYLIFKEMINNIAKHSYATRVTIHYKQQGNSFELFVSNNLPNGFDESAIGNGQGLKNMKMRATKIAAKLNYNYSEDEFFIHLKKP
jgi:ligand-binding sensor domain-containing protein/signal transduction histidine kinase